MSYVPVIAFFISYETAILLTVILAAIGTFGAMLAIVFFAWAPHLSLEWATEFGVDTENEKESTS